MQLDIFLTFLICMVITDRSEQNEDAYLTFPEGFKFGAAGSAYQIEGGWNASGKGESVWDRAVHTKRGIKGDGTGDIACDSYHKYKEDVQLVKNMELDHYRLSISWSRVLPDGCASSINRKGLRYYHNLIDELIANGIEPVVTLYHWDHPQVLEDMGGWLNESMVTWFTDYADVIFREFGPKVKIFTTLNEPEAFCPLLYVGGAYAPVKQLEVSAAYLCGHNALKAHARAYHLYDQKYRPTQHGQIGAVSFSHYYYSKNPKDAVAAEMMFQYMAGWMTHPIYLGGYHDVIKNRIAKLNREARSPESRIPELSPEWVDYIKGTFDYFGLTHYTSYYAKFGTGSESQAYFYDDIGILLSNDPSWEIGPYGEAAIVPEGFGHLLRKIKSDYNNPPVYILENGVDDFDPVNDKIRMKYLHSYLKELLLAVNRDGCNVQKYFVWSLFDSFEWREGYTCPMGLIHVNFSSPNRERSPKLSASWLRDVVRSRRLQPPIRHFKNST